MYRQAMDHSVSKQCDSQNSLNSSQLPDGLSEYQTTKIFIPVNLIGGTQIGALPLLLSTAIVEIIYEPINVQRDEKEGQIFGIFSISQMHFCFSQKLGLGWAENHRNSRGLIYFCHDMEVWRSHGRKF